MPARRFREERSSAPAAPPRRVIEPSVPSEAASLGLREKGSNFKGKTRQPNPPRSHPHPSNPLGSSNFARSLEPTKESLVEILSPALPPSLSHSLGLALLAASVSHQHIRTRDTLDGSASSRGRPSRSGKSRLSPRARALAEIRKLLAIQRPEQFRDKLERGERSRASLFYRTKFFLFLFVYFFFCELRYLVR